LTGVLILALYFLCFTLQPLDLTGQPIGLAFVQGALDLFVQLVQCFRDLLLAVHRGLPGFAAFDVILLPSGLLLAREPLPRLVLLSLIVSGTVLPVPRDASRGLLALASLVPAPLLPRLLLSQLLGRPLLLPTLIGLGLLPHPFRICFSLTLLLLIGLKPGLTGAIRLLRVAVELIHLKVNVQTLWRH